MATLFLGNGINRINDNNNSWENLLRRLIMVAKKDNHIQIEGKPFPLLYEEIFLRGQKYNKVQEEEFKDAVASEMFKISDNPLNNDIFRTNCSNIITTNYDYGIEGIECKAQNATSSRIETKFRLHTFNTFNNCKIWHIHGEANYKDTLVLGHERYANVLKGMINYLDDKFIGNLGDNLENFILDPETNSWLDLFLKEDIHILGFGFDYNEIDLWWLINKRARLKYQFGRIITNTVYYYMAEGSNPNFNKLRQLLTSHDVKIVTINERIYSLDFYKRAIEKTLTIYEQWN